MLPTISCSSRGNQLISTTLSLAFNRRLALNFVRFSFNQRKYSVFGSQGPGKFRQLPKDATVLYQLSYSAWAWLIATESVRSSEISISSESVSLITATIRQKLLLLIIKSNALSLSFTLPSPLSLSPLSLSSLSLSSLSLSSLSLSSLSHTNTHTHTHTHTHAPTLKNLSLANNCLRNEQQNREELLSEFYWMFPELKEKLILKQNIFNDAKMKLVITWQWLSSTSLVIKWSWVRISLELGFILCSS